MSETQTTTWLCEKCGEVRSSRHDENMCAKIAELKDRAAQLRGALQRCASYVGGSVDATASHLFHVMVADEVSSVVERLKKRNAALLDIIKECKDQWGDDYFWEKWGLSDRIKESEA